MEEDLVPLFMPSLSAILVAAEDKKNSPLTEQEALEIRDKSTCIMVTREHSEKMAESRGYRDIDPENCWYDWQMLRREMGRKPELDPGAKIDYRASGDPGMAQAIQNARESLDEFRSLISEHGVACAPLVKKTLEDENARIHMWLLVEEVDENKFIASLFEVPTAFTSYKEGDRFTVQEEDLLDWMLNLDGVLYGGYTLRQQRSQMTESEQMDFDHHIGVHTYA